MPAMGYCQGMRVAVTGATGLVGRAVVRGLLKTGAQVVVLTRDARRAASQMEKGCEIRDWSALRDALRGADAVIHLAGESLGGGRWNAERKRRILDSRVAGTRAVVSAMRELGAEAPRALISASAVGYYGNRGDEVLTESSSAGTGFLAEVAEAWEREAAQAPVARRVTFRLGMVLSFQGGALATLVPLYRAGLGGPVGSGLQWMSWIHLTDVAQLLVSACSDPSFQGVYNAVAPSPVRQGEFAHALATALKRPAWLRAPAWAVKAAAGEMSQLLLDSQRAMPERLLAAGFRFRYPELRAALADILKTRS